MTGFTRKLARQSAASIHSAGRKRSVIVELNPATPTLLGFRLMKCRRVYYLPIDYCFREAVRAEVARERAERKKARSNK